MTSQAIIERLDRLENLLRDNSKENWLTIAGASKYSKLSITRLRKAIAKGELQVSKVGGKLLFKEIWLDEWLSA